MNVNKNFPKANSRLNRIKKISKCVRLILQYGILLWVFAGLAATALNSAELRDYYGMKPLPIKVFSEHPHNTLPPESLMYQMTAWGVSPITLWLILQCVIFMPWYRMVLKLFGLFEKGVLFTAQTAHCFKVLGGVYAVKFLLEWTFRFFFPEGDAWRITGLGMNNLFLGVFLVTIGWLMDEASKIQEEQELTV